MPPGSIVVDPGIALITAAFFGLMTSALTIFGTQWAKSKDRADDRLDRQAVATAVQKVASDVKVANAERNEQLHDIRATGEATHAIVNNQRTVMLRQIAVLAAIVARDHPEDELLQKAAHDAAADLAENERMNADPETKPKLQGALDAETNGKKFGR